MPDYYLPIAGEQLLSTNCTLRQSKDVLYLGSNSSEGVLPGFPIFVVALRQDDGAVNWMVEAIPAEGLQEETGSPDLGVK